MATFQFQGKNIFYQINGEGKPILILNGIMMSTMSWEPFVDSFSEHNMFIRLDFLDQGKSDRVDFQYEQTLQVEVVKALLDHLNIKKINLVGISYGGEVAISFATRYQEYLDRLIVFNTTPATSDWLKDIGKSWIAAGKTRNGQAYYQTTIPVIYSSNFYQREIAWMRKREEVLIGIFSNPVFLDAMERLTISAETYNEYESVHKIEVPTLIVAAENDALTPKGEQIKLHQLIKSSHLIEIPNCGHASMYERPLLFVTLVLGFINAKNATYKI